MIRSRNHSRSYIGDAARTLHVAFYGSYLVSSFVGGMAEWTMAPVLKTGNPQGFVGSNPTPSANGCTSFPSADVRDAKPDRLDPVLEWSLI